MADRLPDGLMLAKMERKSCFGVRWMNSHVGWRREIWRGIAYVRILFTAVRAAGPDSEYVKRNANQAK